MSKPRVLVVDDDPKLSHLLAVMLQHCGGCDVIEENRAFAAVTTAEEFQPDVILLDVNMPGKSGEEVAADLSMHPKLAAIPILFVTSLVPLAEAHRNCVQRGSHYYLSKPVMPNVLLATVKSMLETGAPPAVAAA